MLQSLEMALRQKQHAILAGITCVLMIAGLLGCNLPTGQMAPATATAFSARQTLSANLFPTSTIDALATPSSPDFTPEVPGDPDPTKTPLGAIIDPSQDVPDGVLRYVSQSGDTLAVVASHFGVSANEITLDLSIATNNLLPVDTVLMVPDVIEGDIPYPEPVLPDSEVVYGPGADSFDLIAYANQAGGYLTRYTERLDDKVYTGPEIVHMVAVETSTNPRLLLAFLDFRSNWVFGNPTGAESNVYPIGFRTTNDKGLYKELMIAARMLAEGYYGWRYATLSNMAILDTGSIVISPTLNAGSVAVQKLFASLYYEKYWVTELYGPDGFLVFYEDIFGDPWVRAADLEPLLNANVQQPDLALPFLPGLRWAFTAGPHAAWQTGTPRAAVDFAPVTGEPACAVSNTWTTAAAPGLVVRSSRGTLALDLDGDGDEGTGWVLVYMHVAEKERAEVGSSLDLDGLIGHPSCERGNATGTHLHFTRKYNGEWIATDGPLPMILDGWQAFAGERRYEGTLVRAYQTVTANVNGMTGSSIYRDDD